MIMFKELSIWIKAIKFEIAYQIKTFKDNQTV